MNYSEVEIKVREATNDEAWGPHGSLMKEIAQMTFKYELFNEVMNALWKRVFQPEREQWRSTYKALVMLAYLLRNGSEKVVNSCRDRLFDLKGLESYTYVDEKGKDQGLNSKSVCNWNKKDSVYEIFQLFFVIYVKSVLKWKK